MVRDTLQCMGIRMGMRTGVRVDGAGEVWRAFLRLGATAFGGPAAHISAMDDEFVRRRGWLSRGEFADLLSASQLLPGPSSTELAMLIGHRRAGWGGLIAAGVAFIVPSVMLVWALAWAYVTLGDIGAVAAIMGGVRPVVCAVLGVAVWRLAPGQPRTMSTLGVLVASIVLQALGAHELVVLLCAALSASMLRVTAGRLERIVCGALAVGLVALAFSLPSNVGVADVPTQHSAVTTASGVHAEGAPSVSAIGWSFARIGSTVFGSGYVLVAYVRRAFVDGTGLLTETQLLDAIAVGQVTPGPVFSTATFVGYLLAGGAGAIAATVGIFLPAFLFAAVSGPLVPKLRASARASAALDGLNAGSLAILFIVLLETVRDTMGDPLSVAIAVVSLVLLLVGRISALWVLLGGALLGILSPYADSLGVALIRSFSS